MLPVLILLDLSADSEAIRHSILSSIITSFGIPAQHSSGLLSIRRGSYIRWDALASLGWMAIQVVLNCCIFLEILSQGSFLKCMNVWMIQQVFVQSLIISRPCNCSLLLGGLRTPPVHLVISLLNWLMSTHCCVLLQWCPLTSCIWFKTQMLTCKAKFVPTTDSQILHHSLST